MENQAGKNNRFMRTEFKAYAEVYMPFFLVLAIGILYHFRMQVMGGDDVFFSQATEGRTLWEYLGSRYMEWTSRVVSEFILVNIIQVPLLWRILDCLFFVTLPMILSKLFGGGRIINWCAAGAVLLYPFHDMGTAGWITTTVTHFWPVWGIFFVSLLLKKIATAERISLPEAVIGILACVMTGSHEQYAVIMMVVQIMVAVYIAKVRVLDIGRANRIIFLILFVINVLSLIVILMCPGNAGRNAVSIADLPIYATFGFGEKLYLGLLSIERVFIANADAVFLAVILVWSALVYLKTDNFKKTLISAIPLMILFGQTVVRTAYPGLSGLFPMPGEVLEWSWREMSTWLPMVYLAMTVASMVYTLYVLFGENLFTCFSVLILLGLGFGAGMVVGFMATIYVSGERVYAPLYFILLLVTLLAVYSMGDQVQKKIKQTGGKLVVTVLALLVLINVGFVTLSF